jgi:hypothetical protein
MPLSMTRVRRSFPPWWLVIRAVRTVAAMAGTAITVTRPLTDLTIAGYPVVLGVTVPRYRCLPLE